MRTISSLIFILILTFTTTVFADTGKKIAITVDDLPGRDNATVVLHNIQSALKASNAPATGYVIGSLVGETKNGSQLLKSWSENGFVLGNHTWSHQNFSDQRVAEWLEEVNKTEKVLKPYQDYFGPWQRSFRFPRLNQGKTEDQEFVANRYFKQNNTLIAYVSVDTSDWAFAMYYDDALNKGKTKLAVRIAKLYMDHIVDCVHYAEEASSQLFNRQLPQILLLHANALNADNMKLLLDNLKDLDYSFISLNEALADHAYRPYNYKIAFQKGESFYDQISHLIHKPLSGPDRTSYSYFKSEWEPKLKNLE